MINPNQIKTPVAFLKVATLFESGLVLIAYIIGWLGGVNPLAHLHFDGYAVGLGIIGTLPLYGLFALSYRLPIHSMKLIKELLINRLGYFLYSCNRIQLAYLGLLAGFTEEVLFRGTLQPLIENHWGYGIGLIGSNILFGMAHAITPLYALLAGLTGCYLGWSLDFAGDRNLIIPVFIHGLYDYWAFLAVAKTYRSLRGFLF